MCGIVCPIQDITSSLYDLKPPCLCITPTIFDIVSTLCGCVITSTVLLISHELYFWDHFHYNSRHHIHCIRHDSHRFCVITPTRSMISHPFRYDSTPTICTISYKLYKASHPYFMRSHHILYDITCIVSWHHSLYIWHYVHSICVIMTSESIIPHQLSIWHHTHSMYEITICMHDITWTLYDFIHV